MSNENTKKPLDEKKQAAISYIGQFYNEVMTLTTNYSQYNNMILELKEKYGIDSIQDKLTDQERSDLINAITIVRQNITLTYIKYKVIIEQTKGTNITKEKREELYNKYVKVNKEKYVIGTEDLESYVIILNEFLVSNIMTELIQTTQTYINEIYGTT
jgi:hypothetical protein